MVRGKDKSEMGEVSVLSIMQTPTQRDNENEETKSYVPNKGKDSSLKTNLNEIEICNLSYREFKITARKMLTDQDSNV